MKITLIGDVHGEIDNYTKLVKESKSTLQVGDIGWPYMFLNSIDYRYHKILPGNHDNYTLIKTGLYPHFLTDYGMWDKIFYIRGAFSIDYRFRSPGIDWWPEEELTKQQIEDCFRLYKLMRPEIVVSHDAPYEICKLIGKKSVLEKYEYNPDTFSSHTSLFLQKCFEEHQPSEWYFGHHHCSWNKVVRFTRFRCLDRMETYELILSP